jgi:hypothetical protein
MLGPNPMSERRRRARLPAGRHSTVTPVVKARCLQTFSPTVREGRLSGPSLIAETLC